MDPADADVVELAAAQGDGTGIADDVGAHAVEGAGTGAAGGGFEPGAVGGGGG